ncbi:hypothetical protein TRIATDRAFT_284732 [Trichoderma atroviride IMI 206040]|uniref:Uncharacterized protein n=1 Tax=Hypocrea atroviridis (strain ATCC 20476 / IMI 206040) TaxID=452589 RepID=G9NZV2_HYPAI|nr:uncharacterized protein TRIATDRAFT_284732 [Trichoderma atroviride IMI 206040]EHK43999.1 hypothetical protein TRIATDRAFT_284732 [Trichoderma atroviride IMI 206040]
MPKIRAQVRIEYSRRQMLGTHQPQAQHTGNALQELLDSSDGLRALRTWNMDGWRWHRRRRSCLDQSDYAHLARTTHSANASAQACICRFYSCTCSTRKMASEPLSVKCRVPPCLGIGTSSAGSWYLQRFPGDYGMDKYKYKLHMPVAISVPLLVSHRAASLSYGPAKKHRPALTTTSFNAAQTWHRHQTHASRHRLSLFSSLGSNRCKAYKHISWTPELVPVQVVLLPIVVHDHELLQAPNLLEVVLFLIRASFRASLAEEELDQQRRIYSGLLRTRPDSLREWVCITVGHVKSALHVPTCSAGTQGYNMATFQVQYSFLRAAPAVSLRNTTTALYSFLHGLHIHPCYDAGSAEDGPTRVLHLGSLLTLSRSDKESFSVHTTALYKYIHRVTGLHMRCDVGMEYCKCSAAESSFLDDISMRINLVHTRTAQYCQQHQHYEKKMSRDLYILQ